MRISRCLWRVLLFAALLVSLRQAYAAAFPPQSDRPLTEEEADKVLGIRQGDRIYSGDVIYLVADIQQFGFRRNLWPNGVLVYAFDAGLSQVQQIAFKNACEAWTVGTPLRCELRSNETDYVLVRNHDGEGCGGQKWVSCSFVGRIGGQQDLLIYRSHWNAASVIQHEIGHAIGMVHEQSRPDRDAYVFVKYGNMRAGSSRQFDIARGVSLFTEYDLESIMHYSNCDFSRHTNCSLQRADLQTLEPRACNRERVGGASITQLDLDGVRAAYSGRISSLFRKNRSASCGVHNLSAAQVKLMCGDNCLAASPVKFRKVEERSGSDCGAFHVDPDYSEICRAFSKEYVRHWTDMDEFSCIRDGLPTTRFEWWVECGCSEQALPAKCTDYSTGLDRTKLAELLDSADPLERPLLHYLNEVLKWQSIGAIDKRVAETFSSVVMGGAPSQQFSDQVYALLCDMRIVIEAKRLSNPGYSLPYSMFATLARQYGVKFFD